MGFEHGQRHARPPGIGRWIPVVLILASLVLAASQPFPRRFPRQRLVPYPRWPTSNLRNNRPELHNRNGMRPGLNFRGQRNQFPFQQALGQRNRLQRQPPLRQLYNDVTRNRNTDNTHDINSILNNMNRNTNANPRSNVLTNIPERNKINGTLSLQNRENLFQNYAERGPGGLVIRQELMTINSRDLSSSNGLRKQKLKAQNDRRIQFPAAASRRNDVQTSRNRNSRLRTGLQRQSNRIERGRGNVRSSNSRSSSFQRDFINNQRRAFANHHISAPRQRNGLRLQTYNSAQKTLWNFNRENSPFRNSHKGTEKNLNTSRQISRGPLDYRSLRLHSGKGKAGSQKAAQPLFEQTTLRTYALPKAKHTVLYNNVAFPSMVMRASQEADVKRQPLSPVPVISHLSAKHRQQNPFSPVHAFQQNLATDSRQTDIQNGILNETGRYAPVKHQPPDIPQHTNPVEMTTNPFAPMMNPQDILITISDIYKETKSNISETQTQVLRPHNVEIDSKVHNNIGNNAFLGILGTLSDSSPESVYDMKPIPEQTQSNSHSSSVKSHSQKAETPERKVWGHFAPLKPLLDNGQSSIVVQNNVSHTAVNLTRHSNTGLNTKPKTRINDINRDSIASAEPKASIHKTATNHVGFFSYSSLNSPKIEPNLIQVNINENPISRIIAKHENEVKPPMHSTGRIGTIHTLQDIQQHVGFSNEMPESNSKEKVKPLTHATNMIGADHSFQTVQKHVENNSKEKVKPLTHATNMIGADHSFQTVQKHVGTPKDITGIISKGKDVVKPLMHSTGVFVADRPLQFVQKHIGTSEEKTHPLSLPVKNNDSITKPRTTFGAGMFGYRRNGDYPPNYQKKSFEYKENTANLALPVGDIIHADDRHTVNIKGNNIRSNLQEAVPNVFSPIFGIGMPMRVDHSKPSTIEASNQHASNIAEVTSDTSIRGRFLINHDQSLADNIIQNDSKFLSQKKTINSPPSLGNKAGHLKVSGSFGTLFENNLINRWDDNHVPDFFKDQNKQPLHFKTTKPTTAMATTTTPLIKSTQPTVVHNEIDVFADKLLSLFLNDNTPKSIPANLSPFVEPVPEKKPVPQIHNAELSPIHNVHDSYNVITVNNSDANSNSIISKNTVMIGTTVNKDQTADIVEMVPDLSTNSGHGLINNPDQLNENMISSFGLSHTHQGHDPTSNTNIHSNNTYINTIAALLDSIPPSDLTTLITNINLNQSLGFRGALDTSMVQETDRGVVSNASQINANFSPVGLDFIANTGESVSREANNRHSVQLNSDAILSTVSGTNIASNIAIHNGVHAHGFPSEVRPDVGKNDHTEGAHVPFHKIGNIKVNSAQPSFNASVPDQDNSHPNNIIVDPNLSIVDFGVVVNQQTNKQDSSLRKNVPIVPTSVVPLTESLDTGSLLDDLLLGLRQILDPDPTTPAPTITTTTKATTTVKPCLPSSPTFKCTGKGMFKTLDTMGEWCLKMCRTSGCIETACECACQPKKPHIAISKKKWKRKRKKILKPKHKTRKQQSKKKQKRPRAKWQRPKKALHVRQWPNKGKRKLRSMQTKKQKWQKPKPTTEEPPEIEMEDIVTTTTAMPSTTEEIYWDYHSTISPFEDIKLQQVEETHVRAEKIHLTEIPQVQWASEIKSRLKKLAKNAIKANEPKGWQDEPLSTTLDPYYTTVWDITPPVTSTAPPTREWERQWPTPRPTERWSKRSRDTWPANRWPDKPPRAYETWGDGSPQHDPPPRDHWRDSRARYDPPPTYSSNQWDQRGGDGWSRGWGNQERGNAGYNGGWDNRNNRLRSSWGRRGNNKSSGGGEGQEQPEAPDK